MFVSIVLITFSSHVTELNVLIGEQDICCQNKRKWLQPPNVFLQAYETNDSECIHSHNYVIALVDVGGAIVGEWQITVDQRNLGCMKI